MSFEHPNNEDIEFFLEGNDKINKVQKKNNNPIPFSTFMPEALSLTAFYFALFGTFFVNVNPYGSKLSINFRGEQNKTRTNPITNLEILEKVIAFWSVAFRTRLCRYKKWTYLI